MFETATHQHVTPVAVGFSDTVDQPGPLAPSPKHNSGGETLPTRQS